jgi:hypothetical protein
LAALQKTGEKMPAGTEVAKLTRDVKALIDAVALDLRPGSKTPMPLAERRNIRGEIEKCMQALDELRTRLT